MVEKGKEVSGSCTRQTYVVLVVKGAKELARQRGQWRGPYLSRTSQPIWAPWVPSSTTSVIHARRHNQNLHWGALEIGPTRCHGEDG